MRAWGRLLRLSLLPSPLADVVAGIVFAGAAHALGGWRPWRLVLGSLAIYHGSLALNDWADREHDGRTRPDRPIPSGAVRPGAALAVASASILAGVLLAAWSHPASGAWMGGVAALAVLYDLAGRGPRIGPALLATCRGGNLASGILWASWSGASPVPATLAILPAALYATYVLAVSSLGRMEDAEDAGPLARRPSAHLTSAALALAAVPLLPHPDASWTSRLLPALVAWIGAAGLWRAAQDGAEWTRARVERAMGLALRRLLVFAAAVALVAWHAGETAPLVAAAAILAGFYVSRALREVFPPS